MQPRTPSKRELFIDAVRRQSIPEVAALLASGVSPNIIVDFQSMLTAVQYAQKIKNDGLLALLVTYEGKLESTPAPKEASIVRMEPVAEPLMSFEPVSDSKLKESKKDRFAIAILNNEQATILHLLSVMANHHIHIDSNKNNALHYATFIGNLSLIKLLASHSKIQLEIKNQEGKTPLDYLIEAENREGLQALVGYPGFSVQIQSKFEDAIKSIDQKKIDFLTLNFFEHLKLSSDLASASGLAVEDQSPKKPTVFRSSKGNVTVVGRDIYSSGDGDITIIDGDVFIGKQLVRKADSNNNSVVMGRSFVFGDVPPAAPVRPAPPSPVVSPALIALPSGKLVQVAPAAPAPIASAAPQAAKSQTASQKISDDYTEETKAYISSFKNKPKNTETFDKLNISENEEGQFRDLELIDSKSLEVMNIPVSVCGTLYDLATLAEQPVNDSGKRLTPNDRKEFLLRDIQPARYANNAIEKLFTQIRKTREQEATVPAAAPAVSPAQQAPQAAMFKQPSTIAQQPEMNDSTGFSFLKFLGK